jgi:hypothetical protein
MNDAQEPTYLSYMLRLWREEPRAPWRASLHSTATGQIHLFGDVERMWAYLNAQMEGERDGPPDAPEQAAPE